MPLNSLGLGFVFTARDLASGQINNLTRNFLGMDAAAVRATAGYQRNFAVMGAGLGIMAAGAGALAGAFALSSLAGEFEAALAHVGGVAEASAEEMTLLHDAAIQAGIATQFSPTQAVGGLEALASAGFNAREAITALVPVLDLAAAGGITVEASATAMSSAMNIFGTLRTPEAVGLLADQFVAISNSTNLAAGDLTSAMANISRGAIAAGAGIEEMLPAIGLIRNTGAEASVAAHGVSAAIAHMAENSDAFSALGIHVTDASGSFRSVLDIMGETSAVLDQRFPNAADRATQAAELFGHFGVGAFQSVGLALERGVRDRLGVLHTGTDAIDFLRDSMLQAGGAAEEMRLRMLNTLSGQQTLLTGSMTTLGILLGEGFGAGFRPIVEFILGGVNRVIAFFNAIPVAVRGAMAQVAVGVMIGTMAVGAFIAASAAIALITPFMGAIAVAATNLATSMLPFIAIGGALVALGYAMHTLVERDIGGLGQAFERSFGAVRLGFQALVQLFTEGAFSGAVMEEMGAAENSGLREFVINLFQIGYRVTQFFRGIGAGFEGALGTMGPSITAMIGAFTRLGEALGFVSSSSSDAVADMPSSEFAETGARIGIFLADIIDIVAQAITWFAEFSIGVMDGARVVGDFMQPVFDDLGVTFGLLFEQVGELLGTFGILSVEGSDQATTWQDFGRIIGGVVVGAVGLLAGALDGVLYVFTSLVWFANQFVLMIRWIAEQGPAAVQRLGRFFLDLADNIANAFGDFQVATAGILTPSMSDEQVLAIHREQSQRTLAMQARGQAVDSYSARLAEGPAMAEAEAAATSERRSDAGMAAVRSLLERQTSARQPLEISLQVDGETIGRVATDGARRTSEASFSSSSDIMSVSE